MGLASQTLKVLFDSGILGEGLDKGAEGEQGRLVHLLDQLGETAGRKPLAGPAPIPFDVEGRAANQEGIGSEAVERLQPARSVCQIGSEGVNVW